MKTLNLVLSLTLATAAAAALDAQTSSTRATGNRITVTGCLERAPAGDDAVIGTSGREPGPIYVLTKPAEGPSGTPGAAGTSGTTERAPQVEYRLRSADLSDLAGQEGARVQITGTPERASTRGKPGHHGKQVSAARTLNVESIKTIASSCSE